MNSAAVDGKTVRLIVNGRDLAIDVEVRTSLADVLRDEIGLTATHLGCEHGVCGACTVLVDGVPMRSCITLAVACEGSEVTSSEGLEGEEVQALRSAFSAEHGLQCGFCTPGMLVTGYDILGRDQTGTPEQIALELSGNICRCTGYSGIVRAIAAAARQLSSATTPEF